MIYKNLTNNEEQFKKMINIAKEQLIKRDKEGNKSGFQTDLKGGERLFVNMMKHINTIFELTHEQVEQNGTMIIVKKKAYEDFSPYQEIIEAAKSLGYTLNDKLSIDDQVKEIADKELDKIIELLK